MFKRMAMVLGLSLALAGGAVTAVHTSSASAHIAAVHADLKVVATENQTVDADPSGPCAIDAAGVETGDCNSQNTSGPEDTAGASSETAAEGVAVSADTDTVQSGGDSNN